MSDKLRERAWATLNEHCSAADKFDCHVDAMIAFAAAQAEEQWERFVEEVRVWGKLDAAPKNFLGSVEKHKECFMRAWRAQ